MRNKPNEIELSGQVHHGAGLREGWEIRGRRNLHWTVLFLYYGGKQIEEMKCFKNDRFQQLKYHTVVDVRSSRGKNAKGHKITGLAVHGDKLLVSGDGF